MSQPWYGMFASVMKHAHDKKSLKFLQRLTKGLQPLAKLDDGIDFIYTLLRYIIKTYDVAKPDFIATVKTNLPFIEERKTMTIAEQYKQEGIQLGKQQGIQLGKQQGMQLGEQKALEAVATKLIKQGVSDDKVSALTDLPIPDIETLKKRLNKRIL